MFTTSQAVKHTLRYRRYGWSTLTLDPFPARVGGTFEADLESGVPVPSRRPFWVALRCEQVTLERRPEPLTAPDDRSTKSGKWLFEQERKLPKSKVQPARFGSSASISIPIPDDLPPTSDSSEERIEWTTQGPHRETCPRVRGALSRSGL